MKRNHHSSSTQYTRWYNVERDTLLEIKLRMLFDFDKLPLLLVFMSQDGHERVLKKI